MRLDYTYIGKIVIVRATVVECPDMIGFNIFFALPHFSEYVPTHMLGNTH